MTVTLLRIGPTISGTERRRLSDPSTRFTHPAGSKSIGFGAEGAVALVAEAETNFNDA